MGLVDARPGGELLVDHLVQVLAPLLLGLRLRLPEKVVHDLLKEECVRVGVVGVDDGFLPVIGTVQPKLLG